MSATATKKTKPASFTATLDTMHESTIATARGSWRGWIIDAADERGLPATAELLDAAHVLGITDAVASFRADVAAVVEARQLAQREALCHQAAADRLAEFGGKVENLRDEIEKARQAVQRLEEIDRFISHDGGSSTFTTMLHQLKVRHPRAWPGFPKVKEDL